MIVLDSMPCIDCKFYNGIFQLNEAEKDEYIKCKKSDNHNAELLLKKYEGKIVCKEFQNKYEEEGDLWA